MREIDDAKLAQVSGGGELPPPLQEVLDSFERRNCNGCAKKGEPGCQREMEVLLFSLRRCAEKNTIPGKMPTCHYK